MERDLVMLNPVFIISFFCFCTFYIFNQNKKQFSKYLSWIWTLYFMNRLPYAANSVSVSSYFFCFVILGSASRRFSFLRFSLFRIWQWVLVMLDTDLPVIALIAEIFLLSSISSHTESSEGVNVLACCFKYSIFCSLFCIIIFTPDSIFSQISFPSNSSTSSVWDMVSPLDFMISIKRNTCCLSIFKNPRIVSCSISYLIFSFCISEYLGIDAQPYEQDKWNRVVIVTTIDF